MSSYLLSAHSFDLRLPDAYVPSGSDLFDAFFVYAVFKVRPCLLKINTGGHLLSRTVSSAVPSAGRVLTVVFGMGTGVAPDRIAA